MNNNTNPKPFYLRPQALVPAALIVLITFAAYMSRHSEDKDRSTTALPPGALPDEYVELDPVAQATEELAELRERLDQAVRELRLEQERMLRLRRQVRTGGDFMTDVRARQEAAMAAFDAAFERHPDVIALFEEERKLDREMAVLARRYGELNRLIDQARRERFAQSRVLMQEALVQRQIATDAIVGGDQSRPMHERLKAINDDQIEQLERLGEEWLVTFRETRIAQQAMRETKTDEEEAYLTEWEQMNQRHREIIARQEQIPEELRRLRVDLAVSDPELRELQNAYLMTVEESRMVMGRDPRVEESLARINEITRSTRELRGQIDTVEQALYEARGEEWPGPWYSRGAPPVVSAPVFDLQSFLPEPREGGAPSPASGNSGDDSDDLSDESAQNFSKKATEGYVI